MSDADQIRLRALVRGRVQGVFFRDFSQSHAQRLRLVGWVHNLPDGATVEIVAEGRRTALEELITHLWEGPPGAVVVDVDVEWQQPLGESNSFRIQ